MFHLLGFAFFSLFLLNLGARHTGYASAKAWVGEGGLCEAFTVYIYGSF